MTSEWPREAEKLDRKIPAKKTHVFSSKTFICLESETNYKNGKNYLGSQEGLKPEDIKEWHVGGRSKMAVTLVEMSIDAKELLLLK